jgi:hypothetical protein
MSFNLNYVTQGLDFSGLGQGIAQGLQQAAAMKRLREEQARKDIEQFRENYNTKNILAKDIADFTTAFEEYKTKALELARLNKGRSKSQKLAEATKAKEFALNKMNSIYSQSAKVNEYAKTLSDYADQLSKNKYRVPQQIADKMNYVLKTPSSMIKDDDMIDPRTIKIEPNANDIRTSQLLFKNIENGIDSDVTEVIKENVPGIGDVEIKAMKNYKVKDPETVLNSAKLALDSMDTLDNKYKDEVDLLKKGLSITETDIIENEALRPIRTQAEARLKDLQNKIGGDFNPFDTDEGNLKAILYADSFGGFDRIPQKTYYDKTAFEDALKLKGIQNQDARYKKAVSDFERRMQMQQQGLDLRSQSLQLSNEKFDYFKQNKKTGGIADLIKKAMMEKK